MYIKSSKKENATLTATSTIPAKSYVYKENKPKLVCIIMKASCDINRNRIIIMLVCFVENERKYEGEKDLRDSCTEYH